MAFEPPCSICNLNQKYPNCLRSKINFKLTKKSRYFYTKWLSALFLQLSSKPTRVQNRLQSGLAPTRSQAGSGPGPDQNPGWPTRAPGSRVGLEPGWPTRPQAGSSPDRPGAGLTPTRPGVGLGTKPASSRVGVNPTWTWAGPRPGLGPGWRTRSRPGSAARPGLGVGCLLVCYMPFPPVKAPIRMRLLIV